MYIYIHGLPIHTCICIILIYVCVYLERERDSHTCVDMSMNKIDNLRTKNGRQSLGGIQHSSITARQWIFKSEGWVNHMTKTMALVEEMIKNDKDI